MKKEFVSYEIALELKELEFDELCFSFYNKEKKLYDSEGYYKKGYNVLNEEIVAPLYQQAFRFFREKYNLHSNIKCVNTTHNNHFRFEIELKGETLACRNTIDSYEDAELSCLRKIIEIIKNKSV